MRKEMDMTYLRVLIREFACKELRETTETPATSHVFYKSKAILLHLTSYSCKVASKDAREAVGKLHAFSTSECGGGSG
jgi:hypothetical protein